MDWSECPDVERISGKMSGAPVIKGTRVPPETILDYVADGYTPVEIVTEHFPSVPLARALGVLRFARHHEAHPA